MEYFPRVQHCCCCFGWSLKKGTLLIGAFLLLFDLITFAFDQPLNAFSNDSNMTGIVNGTRNTSSPTSGDEESDWEVVKTHYELAFFVVEVIMNVILVTGTVMNKPLMLRMWLYFNIYAIVSVIAVGIVSVVMYRLDGDYRRSGIEVLAILITAGCLSYFVVVVNSYYQVLRRVAASRREAPAQEHSNHRET